MKRIAGLDLKIFLDLLSKCFESRIKSHHFDEHDALILDFDLEKDDPRLTVLAKLIPGKWRPPACYRIEEFEFLNPDFLKFLDLTRLEAEHMLNLVAMAPRFEKLIEPFKGQLQVKKYKIKDLSDTIPIIFGEIQAKNLTLREVSNKSGLTQMALHNYKKGTNIRFDNFLKLASVLDVGVELRTDKN